MKYLMVLFLVIILHNCTLHSSREVEEQGQRRIYIYSFSNNCIQLDWYCYSKIGGFSSSKIEFRKANTNDTITIESYYLSDIQIVKDTLKLQIWDKDTSGINESTIPCFKSIQITMDGNQNKNRVDARISRIIKAGVDHTKPHTFNSRAE